MAEILVACIMFILGIYGGFIYLGRKNEIERNREDLKRSRAAQGNPDYQERRAG